MVLLSGATGFLMKHYDHMVNFLNATLIGIVGVVLLVIFCAGLIRIGTIDKLLPFIIGFNAALTGYNLVRRADGRLKYKRMWGVAAGIMMAIGAVAILNIVSRYYTGGDIVYIADLLILVLIAGVFSFLGAILAIRYYKL
jgi:TRAP-type C4-dicarboxylate transport system permease small subunit